VQALHYKVVLAITHFYSTIYRLGASHIAITVHSRFRRIVPIKIIRDGFGLEYGYRGKVGIQPATSRFQPAGAGI
jgi:hypothetical protein